MNQELKAQAEELGVKVDARWGDERLSAEIDKALASEPEQEEVAEADMPEAPEVEAEPEDEKELEASEELVSEAEEYRNVSKTDMHVCGHRLAPGKAYKLADHDFRQSRNMQRIAHAVKLGLIEKV